MGAGESTPRPGPVSLANYCPYPGIFVTYGSFLSINGSIGGVLGYIVAGGIVVCLSPGFSGRSSPLTKTSISGMCSIYSYRNGKFASI